MKKIRRQACSMTAAALVSASLLLLPAVARAHCDSLDGPVVEAARTALEKGDVTPILKWVRPADEHELRHAFAQARAVRGKGPEAKALADRYFFETVVRVHRAGEGAPYTGLKETVALAGPAVVGADRALETRSVDALVQLVTADVAEGIRKRHARAVEAKKHADHNVNAGREFVATYVDYVHYVEGVHAAAARSEGHHGEAEAKEGPAGHHAH